MEDRGSLHTPQVGLRLPQSATLRRGQSKKWRFRRGALDTAKRRKKTPTFHLHQSRAHGGTSGSFQEVGGHGIPWWNRLVITYFLCYNSLSFSPNLQWQRLPGITDEPNCEGEQGRVIPNYHLPVPHGTLLPCFIVTCHPLSLKLPLPASSGSKDLAPLFFESQSLTLVKTP